MHGCPGGDRGGQQRLAGDVYLAAMSILAWGPLMTSGTHETAPHGLAPATAHPGATLGGMDTHECPGGGRGGRRRLAGQR